MTISNTENPAEKTSVATVSKTNVDSKNNHSSNVVVIIILLVLFCILSIGLVVFFLAYIYEPHIESGLYQTCLNSPSGLGCEDCKENGVTGTICRKCEDLNQLIVENKPFSGNDEVYYKKYCSEPVTDDPAKDPITIVSPSQTGERYVDSEWSEFSYILPFGGTISGIAPISHTFGTSSSTASVLGNSIDFSFSLYENSETTSINVSLVSSEGMYYFYDDYIQLVDSSKNLYRIQSTVPNWFEYTDSYVTEDCENMVTIPQTITSDTCGTGLMFGHTLLSNCKYEGDESEARRMCDEFFKNLTIK
jgi:hypothetical protein